MSAHCPRCSGPRTEPAARSRLTTDRQLTICTPCGLDEADRDARNLPPVPPHDWPVTG